MLECNICFIVLEILPLQSPLLLYSRAGRDYETIHELRGAGMEAVDNDNPYIIMYQRVYSSFQLS